MSQTSKEINTIKYHKTAQFRQVVTSMKKAAQYKGYDEEKNEAIIDPLAVAPTVDYIGTVKTHGTNASIVYHEDGRITLHSRKEILAVITPIEKDHGEGFTQITDYDIDFKNDNAGFAAEFTERRMEAVLGIKLCVLIRLQNNGVVPQYPIKVSGEWVGQGIQSKVGVSFLPKKTLLIFGVRNGENWLPMPLIETISWERLNVYNIMSFGYKEVTIDFNEPEQVQNFLVKCTEEVENECPVAKQLGVEQSLLGEGLVWVPRDATYCRDSGNWFKTKGEKHSVSKTNSVAPVCPEKLASIKEFVEYAVTENRLQQGLDEVGLDQKTIGTFIGWVSRDINDEEADTLQASGLLMKDVGKSIANKARQFYVGKLQEV